MRASNVTLESTYDPRLAIRLYADSKGATLFVVHEGIVIHTEHLTPDRHNEIWIQLSMFKPDTAQVYMDAIAREFQRRLGWLLTPEEK
jgi:hypothetical protein